MYFLISSLLSTYCLTISALYVVFYHTCLIRRTSLHENFAVLWLSSEITQKMNLHLNRKTKMPRKMNLELDCEIKMHEKS